MKVVAIIPARLESTRLPRKLLCDLGGKTILHRTVEAVCNTNLFDEVWVACDHELLMEEATRHGFQAMLTSTLHQSGTDRIAEVAEIVDADFYVNVQADEPFIDKSSLEYILELFSKTENIDVASLKRRIYSPTQIQDPNCVKVVTNEQGRAIYFSRAPIPFDRDGRHAEYFQHIGVYGFTREALLRFMKLKPTALECIEKLENLRMIEHGFKIYLREIDHVGISIDTPDDLIHARNYLNSI